MMDALLRDIRIAARGLGRNPGFTAVAVLTLALGIGATTTVFSVVYGVLFRPLPFPNADRLVEVIQITPGRGSRVGLTPEQVAEWRATSRTLSQIGHYQPARGELTGVSTPVLLNGAAVATTLFGGLGVGPLMGRLFNESDEQPGNTDVVMLHYRTWAGRFGADAQILQRPIVLNGRTYRVIGVMPERFGFPSLAPFMNLNSAGELTDDPEFWIPLPATPRPASPAPANAGITLRQTLALIREGHTIEQATAEANTLMPPRVGPRYPVELVSARVEQARTVRPVLLLFQIGILFVLFIACVNVVNLLLARADDRRHELAIRLSLGATRVQIARHAASEGLLLALAGGGIGCVLTYQLVAWFRTLPPYLLPRMGEVRVDVTVLAFTCAISAASGVVVGLATAFRVLRGDRSGWLGRSAASIATASRRQQPSRVLVVAEIAAGVVLLAGAGLLLTSFTRLTSVDPDFKPSGVFTFRVALPQTRYPTAAAQFAFHDQLASALRQLAPVESVAAGTSGGIGFSLVIDGKKLSEVVVQYRTVAPGYFGTLAIPVRQGREFTERDRVAQAIAVVVNETFARRYLGGIDVIGRRLQFQEWPTMDVIGVVGDARPVQLDAEVRAELYLPQQYSFAAFASPTYVVRTSESARALLEPVRDAVRRLDPDLVVYEATTMDTLLARSFMHRQVYSATSIAFAVVAVVLAAIGLYSVLAYSVGARTREFGIRIALGAQTRAVVVNVLRDAMAMVLLGIAAGVTGALYLSRFLERLLFGVTPQDPATLAAVAVLFTLVSMLACYLPAPRATRVDPVAALRSE